MNGFYSINTAKTVKNEYDLIDMGETKVGLFSPAFFYEDGSMEGGEVFSEAITQEDYDNQFYEKIFEIKPAYKVDDFLTYHFENYLGKISQDSELFLKHIKYVILPLVKRVPKNEYAELINHWLDKNYKMLLQQHLQEKNQYLKKAYEAAIEFSPSAPLSVNINPVELGKTLNYSIDTIKRIVNELVGEGLAKSSLGMGSFFVTRQGLAYLTNLESPVNNIKQSEKLDLILKSLYSTKSDEKYHSITEILSAYFLETSHADVFSLGKKLESSGFVSLLGQPNDVMAIITTDGIEYVEEDSFSNKGTSITHNSYSIAINNSPNANVVNASKDVTIKQNYSHIVEAIDNIRIEAQKDKSIEPQLLEDILECLTEIEDSVKANMKPKFAIKHLIDIGSGISSIASFFITLSEFAGLLPK